jgi:hypothetical protein
LNFLSGRIIANKEHLLKHKICQTLPERALGVF